MCIEGGKKSSIGRLGREGKKGKFWVGQGEKVIFSRGRESGWL